MTRRNRLAHIDPGSLQQFDCPQKLIRRVGEVEVRHLRPWLRIRHLPRPVPLVEIRQSVFRQGGALFRAAQRSTDKA